MLKQSNIYNIHSLQKKVLFFCALLIFASVVSAQQNNLNKVNNHKPLNPLLYNSFKKPIQVNTLFDEYIKPGRFELMYWPNYPLTPAQIEARDRINDRSVGQKIASDIAASAINNLIYGKKSPVAVRPKF